MKVDYAGQAPPSAPRDPHAEKVKILIETGEEVDAWEDDEGFLVAEVEEDVTFEQWTEARVEAVLEALSLKETFKKYCCAWCCCCCGRGSSARSSEEQKPDDDRIPLRPNITCCVPMGERRETKTSYNSTGDGGGQAPAVPMPPPAFKRPVVSQKSPPPPPMQATTPARGETVDSERLSDTSITIRSPSRTKRKSKRKSGGLPKPASSGGLPKPASSGKSKKKSAGLPKKRSGGLPKKKRSGGLPKKSSSIRSDASVSSPFGLPPPFSPTRTASSSSGPPPPPHARV